LASSDVPQSINYYKSSALTTFSFENVKLNQIAILISTLFIIWDIITIFSSSAAREPYPVKETGSVGRLRINEGDTITHIV
jgi:hypothetical protein